MSETNKQPILPSLPANPDGRSYKRSYSPIDKLFMEIDHARMTLTNTLPNRRPCPVAPVRAKPLSKKEQKSSTQKLRVNHTGEVCAQALYLGQASMAKDALVKENLLASAVEEEAHLQWCLARLAHLNAKPSRLNPLWYGLSYGLGVIIAGLGDSISLGFIHATENQVKRHLEEHLATLPSQDCATRVVLETMLKEEQQHADAALDQGGIAFPVWIQKIMWLSSRFMTTLSKHI